MLKILAMIECDRCNGTKWLNSELHCSCAFDELRASENGGIMIEVQMRNDHGSESEETEATNKPLDKEFG
jgi:hypothetical protein